jgi:hypothetical protein
VSRPVLDTGWIKIDRLSPLIAFPPLRFGRRDLAISLSRLPSEAGQMTTAFDAAWERDETAPLVLPETEEQSALREAAATLALIGLSIQQNADLTRDPVTVTIGAYLAAAAIAANSQGR